MKGAGMGNFNQARRAIVRGLTLTLLAGGLVLAGPASAATIEVPEDFNTIQGAVDNADPGDTVAVSKKTNIENVEVPVQNLTIKGAKKGIVIDGYDGGNDYNVEAFANGVKVQNLELRNGSGFYCSGYNRCGASKVSWTGEGDTYCFYASGDNASVKNSKMRGCGSDGIYISGNEAKVTGTSVTRTDSGCIDVNGDDAVITNNRLSSCEDDDGIYVSGEDARVAKNVFNRVDGDFVEISGSGAEVSDNKGTSANSYCFYISGDDAEVTGNTGRFCDGYGIYASGSDSMKATDNKLSDLTDYGIYVSGESPKVNSNSISRVNGSGIDASCSAICGNTSVSNNTIDGTVEDDYGIDVSVTSGTGSAEIIGNKVLNATDDGIYLSVDNAKIKGNTVKGAGSESESGFYVPGDDNKISDNKAVSNGGDGFEISGNSNKLEDNVAKDNDGDGFFVGSGYLDNVLVSNTANDNKADGFENDGTDTVFRKNKASGNRRDCANDGTIAEKQGNDCADGSNFNEPGTASRKRR
jgi:parallel beta-helix repeat protein